MRRLTILLAVFALLLACCAGAEEDRPVITEFEDFTLQTGTVPAYTGPKAEGQPLFVYYQTITGNVSTSAVNGTWIPAAEPVSAEAFTGMIRNAESGIRAQYEANGNILKSYETGDAFERELWGRPALVCDTALLVGINDSETGLLQRCIRITGDYGTYLFSVSAWSEELLEETTDSLVQAIRWKN